MNLLDKIARQAATYLGHANVEDLPQVPLTEFEENEAKKARIKFHREHVRNGPVKFNPPTNGQLRRAEERALRTQTRKTRRRQVRAYLADQREGAVLRSKLQAVGLLSYVQRSRKLDPRIGYEATVWLVQRFASDDLADEQGRVEVTEQVVRDAFQSALNRWESIVGLPTSQIAEEYALPVQVST